MRFMDFLLLGLLALILPLKQAAGQECALEEETELYHRISSSDAEQRPIFSWLDSDNGISLKPTYYGEVFTNAHGGIATKNSTHYEGLLDLLLSVDFEKMQLPIPGRVSLLAQNTHGRGLTQDYIRATQIISNIDSFDNMTQISELWWEFGLFDNNITIRLGKQDLNTEFLIMDSASDFINSAFGLSPSAGLPSYPNPSPAAVLLTDLTPSLGFKFGLWDAFRSNGNGIFSRNGAALFISELEYKYTTPSSQLPGQISVGMTYETSGNVPAGTIPRAFGFYIQFEQLLFREANSTESKPQGLSFFAQHFPTNTSGNSPFPAIPEDGLAGFTYTGLLRGCDDDVAGVGVGWVKLEQGGTDQELMVELFYKAKVNSTMTIQPDIQYINTPSGIHPDALLVGIRVQLDL